MSALTTFLLNSNKKQDQQHQSKEEQNDWKGISEYKEVIRWLEIKDQKEVLFEAFTATPRPSFDDFCESCLLLSFSFFRSFDRLIFWASSKLSDSLKMCFSRKSLAHVSLEKLFARYISLFMLHPSLHLIQSSSAPLLSPSALQNMGAKALFDVVFPFPDCTHNNMETLLFILSQTDRQSASVIVQLCMDNFISRMKKHSLFIADLSSFPSPDTLKESHRASLYFHKSLFTILTTPELFAILLSLDNFIPAGTGRALEFLSYLSPLFRLS